MKPGRERLRRIAAFTLALLLLSPLFCLALLRIPASLRLDVGPGDQGYAFGLSRTWTFDRENGYRNLGRRARFLLPVTVRGPGTLTVWVRSGAGRLRVRFDDGASDEKSFTGLERGLPITFDLPEERLRAHVRLRLESDSTGDITQVSGVSWESADPAPGPGLLVAGSVLLLAPFFAMLAASGSLARSVAVSIATGAVLLGLAAFDPFAALHLTLQAPAVSMLGLVIVALSTLVGPRFTPSFRMLVYFTLLGRCAMLFHPSFYFSDIEMHEVLIERAYHRGFVDLFAHWPEYAGGMGLGAAPLGEGRAAFPFPILFHGLTHAGNGLLHAPVLWLKLNGALFSALALFPARRLSGGRPGAELFAGSLYLLVPCLSQNLLLLKFSAAAGHFFDLMVVAFLAHVSLSIHGFARWLGAALLVAVSLAAYNSGFIHIGLLVLGSLLLAPLLGGMTARDALGLATAALVAVPLGLVSYQPNWVREFATSRFTETAAESEGGKPSPASDIDPPSAKAASSIGLPVLLLGILGAAREVARLPSPKRLLVSSWLFSALSSHGLRFVFPVLLLQQKEAYWAAAAFAVLGGLFLARLSESGNRWKSAAAALALAASAGELLRWFSIHQSYFFSNYLFR
jgi:hypothetical protein